MLELIHQTYKKKIITFDTDSYCIYVRNIEEEMLSLFARLNKIN